LIFYQESMERSGSVNLRELAQKLTTLIGDKLSYIITDDVQYHNNVIRDEKNEYVAGVLTLERPFVSANGYYRENNYSILFYIRQENKMDFISDLSNFINSETTEIIDDNYVQKIYQTPIYQREETMSGVDYIVYQFDFVYSMSKAITGAYSTLLIDDVEVPFNRIEQVHDTSYVSSILAKQENLRLTNDDFVLTLPLIVSNPKIKELYDLKNSDYFNIKIKLTINGVDFHLAIKRFAQTIERGGNVTNLIVVASTWYERTPIYIDEHLVSIAEYRFEMKKQSTPSALGSMPNRVRSYQENIIMTLSGVIVNDGSLAYQKMKNDMKDGNLTTTYQVVDGEHTYLMVMTNCIEIYTETGNTSLSFYLQEYGD